jgi:hypothetical protein
MGSPVGTFDLSETAAPLGERHERRLAYFVGHVGDAIDVRQKLHELLLGKFINSLQESLGKLLGGCIPVEICRNRDVTLGQMAAEVLGRDAANESVEIGHGRRTFCLPALGGADGWLRRPSVTLD